MLRVSVWLRRLVPYVVMFAVWEVVRRAADLTGFAAWIGGLATLAAAVAISVRWSGDSAASARERTAQAAALPRAGDRGRESARILTAGQDESVT